ncbi:hypothetical protein GCM10023225_14230 [Kineococcus glutinatus]|uniref:Uncharacterized protein n=1 Tax=Kineococcus glutinatus TaxID=1070872 RepID=A0ABP9HN72_9ACTN
MVALAAAEYAEIPAVLRARTAYRCVAPASRWACWYTVLVSGTRVVPSTSSSYVVAPDVAPHAT